MNDVQLTGLLAFLLLIRSRTLSARPRQRTVQVGVSRLWLAGMPAQGIRVLSLTRTVFNICSLDKGRPPSISRSRPARTMMTVHR